MSAMNWGSAASFPAVYEELNVPAFFVRFAERLVAAAALRPGERMLDVATGTGVVLREARARQPELGRLVGLDLGQAMLDIAREKLDRAEAELVLGDATALPFEDGSFDVLTCQQGVQFFPDRPLALREFHRVLAPAGRVLVSCWADMASSHAHDLIASVVAEHRPELEPAARAPYQLPDPTALGNLLTEALFDGVAVERVELDAHFASPEALTRSYLQGTPIAIQLAEVSDEERDALAAAVTAAVRERFGDDIASPMATNVATGRA
jgi:SAM-dependent methyltransferase